LTSRKSDSLPNLRIMHAKVNELSHIVNFLRQRHSEQDIVAYADSALLASDIEQVDDRDAFGSRAPVTTLAEDLEDGSAE
jgi:hypothetical protein